tara:strand:+ start:123 stop:527 length:405 start_codon:yes stop_codon:yes gene_type:complete
MMEESYAELVRKSEKYKTDKSNKNKEVSKDRLLKISKKKIQTTMIGALSTVEKHFGFLWGHENPDALTPEQEHMKELYDLVRSEILDRGNNQGRNLETEFMNYDINWLRYQITLPLKPLNKQEEGDDSNGEEQI